jgi:HK97 family phage portal protein
MKEALLQRLVNDFIWNFRGVNLEDPRRPIDGFTVAELLGGGSASKSGKSVNQDNAMTIAAAWRAIQILGGAVSSIPCKVYKKTDTGREILKNYPAVDLLTDRPNKKYTTPVWMDRAINHLHLRGNHYALPKRNELGQVIELILINPDEVEVFEDSGDVYYRVNRDNTYSSEKFIHVPHLGTGIIGKSTISYAKDDLGIEMSRKDYSGTVYASGGKPPGLLSPSQFLKPEQRAEATKAWNEAKKEGGDVIPPFGFTYTPMGFRPDEVEYLQGGNFSVATVARWFGTPRHKLFDPEGGSYNSNEQSAIEFLSDTIAPILVKFEYEYSSKLFQLPREQRYYMEYDMNAYVRADTTTRFEAYAKGIHAGVMQPSEARSRENLPFVKGTDRNFINSGSIPLDLMDDFVKGKGKNLNASTVAKLKAKFNGQTQEILDILNE